MASKFIGDHHGDGSNLTNVNANLLDGVDSTSFLRSDTAGIMTYNTSGAEMLKFANNTSGGYVQLGFQQNDTDGMHHRAYIKSYKSPSNSIAGVFEIQMRGVGGGANEVFKLETTQDPKWKNNKMWHAGNDGSGSGLDADLLDGQQGSAYLLKSGGTMTGTIDMGSANNIGYRFNGRSISWNSAMQSPTSYVPHIMQQTYTGWDPIMGIKTTNGFWQFGAYSSDTIHFGYMGGAFGSHSTNAFDQQFWFNKDGSFVASGDITAYSDERLKSEVVTIPNALDKVSSMRGVDYIKDGKPSTGVIAQEVEAVKPELVHTADDEMGTKSVAYGNMAGMFIEAIKELKERVEALEKENAELRNK